MSESRFSVYPASLAKGHISAGWHEGHYIFELEGVLLGISLARPQGHFGRGHVERARGSVVAGRGQAASSGMLRQLFFCDASEEHRWGRKVGAVRR